MIVFHDFQPLAIFSFKILVIKFMEISESSMLFNISLKRHSKQTIVKGVLLLVKLMLLIYLRLAYQSK